MQQLFLIDASLKWVFSPAIDPLDSSSTILSEEIVGETHYRLARDIQEILQKYQSLQDIIAILGMDRIVRR